MFLTHSPPRPEISGDRMRTFHLMRELRRRGWHVSLFSLVAPDEPIGLDAALALVADEWLLFPRRASRASRLAIVGIALLRRRAFQQDWFWSSAAFAACRGWLDASPRAILCVEQLFMFRYVPAAQHRRVVLDTQNLEVARIRAISEAGASPVRRVVARLQYGPVERYEAGVVQRVARVLAVSPAEQTEFEKLAPGRVRLVPNGVDCRAINPLMKPPHSRNLLYLGSMSYGANMDAVTHFLDKIAPLVRTPGASIDIVGASPPTSISRAASRSRMRATVTGFVSDVGPHYRGSRMLVVPLRHGGGTRLKILEALAWGLPVVTTSVGCAGLGLTEGREALIADCPKEFAAAVDRLLLEDDVWTELSRAGRAFVEQRFDWQAIGGSFDEIMREAEAAS